VGIAPEARSNLAVQAPQRLIVFAAVRVERGQTVKNMSARLGATYLRGMKC
jgi:hypothetical protein